MRLRLTELDEVRVRSELAPSSGLGKRSNSPPSPLPDPSARLAYGLRLEAAKRELLQLDRQSAWVANLRMVVFAAALLLGGMTAFHRLSSRGWWGTLAAFAVFLLLVVVHSRLSAAEARKREHVTLNERGLARLDGRWRSFSGRGEAYAPAGHLYAADLDVVGQGSLFQLLDETATLAGEAALASALLDPPPLEVARGRQGAVRELAALLDFRQALVAEARAAAPRKANPAPFIGWAEAPPRLTRVGWVRPLPFFLPPLTLALYLLGNEDRVPGWAFWIPLALQLGVVLLSRAAFTELFNTLSMGEGGLVRLEASFAQVEAQRFTDPLLLRLTGGLGGEGAPVSALMKSLSRRYGLAELRRNQLHPLINTLTLFDALTLFRLEAWRRQHGAKVRGWFEALAELEMLSCLGGFAHDRPEATYPELLSEGTRFVASGLGHPLLDAPVANDVTLAAAGHGLVITGSNMSGKTTLLRAMGVTVVLARAGAPVTAEKLEVTGLALMTSMRVKDSLERGVSYFYAEVQRLKAVLDGARAEGGQALVLLDEILLGTNTRERQIASYEVLTLLVATGALVAISTHDLTLATLETETAGRMRNVHFRDELKGEEMSFDYQLRPGVVETTNALRVLRLAGIPVRTPATGSV